MCDDCWGMDGEYDEPFEEEVLEESEWGGFSWAGAAMTELGKVLASKRGDYSSGGEFENFTSSAEAVGTIEPEDVFLTQIAIKLGRIRSLRTQVAEPGNESLKDSYRDLAGYAVLAFAYEMKVVNEEPNEGTDSEKGIYRKRL